MAASTKNTVMRNMEILRTPYPQEAPVLGPALPLPPLLLLLLSSTCESDILAGQLRRGAWLTGVALLTQQTKPVDTPTITAKVIIGLTLASDDRSHSCKQYL